MTIRSDLPNAVRRAGRQGWSVEDPRRLQLALDGASVVLGVGTFFQVADPDVLLHCLWVVLAVEAFLFGLRFMLLRIALATIFVFAYAKLAEPSPSLIDLELTEWPLMTAIAIIVAIMADRLASTSRRYAGLYREASNRLLTAQEDERRRLARDLHDGVGQTLTALTFTLDAAESMLWAGEPQPSTLTQSAVGRAQELAALALDETRDVAFRLRPARFAEIGLGAGIQELAATSGVAVEVRIDPDLLHPRLLDADSEMEAYRIVQEALGNAARYAFARRIWIVMETNDGKLQVTVGDDGVGFDPNRTAERGLGLAGMSERAILLRADLSIRSTPGSGTTITFSLPLPSGAATADQAATGGRLASSETVAAQ